MKKKRNPNPNLNPRRPKVLFWSIYMDTLLTGRTPPVAIGGADVQLTFWAQAFREKGWEVYSYYYRWEGIRKRHHGITFLLAPLVRKLMFVFKYLKFLWLIPLRPDAVFIRDGGTDVPLLVRFSRLLGFKLVYMVAHDVEFKDQDPENIRGVKKAVLDLDYLVVQNAFQKQCIAFLDQRHKDVPLIPNIWRTGLLQDSLLPGTKGYQVVWIGNIREFKRPEWIIELARRMPDVSFAMIGAVLDQKLFGECKREMMQIQNLDYLGPLSLQEVQYVLGESRILLSTSRLEGFPNVFLQAWDKALPVVSSVNPNDVITRYGLGHYAEDLDGLEKGLERYLHEISEYDSCQGRIEEYMRQVHDPEPYYQVLVDYFWT